MAIVATLSKDVAAKLRADAVAEGRSTDEIADEAIMLRRRVLSDATLANHYHIDNSVTNNTTKIGGTWTILSNNVTKFVLALRAKVPKLHHLNNYILGFAVASIIWGYVSMTANIGH